MKYARFEDLPVWQSAIELAVRMFEFTKNPAFRGQGDLANQLQRAALSVSNNIAEGFERGSTNELIQYLYIARGSAGEVRSMFCVIERMTDFLCFSAEVAEFKALAESVSRQIRGWTNSLQNSDVAGQRHLNDQSRNRYNRKEQQKKFHEGLANTMEQVKDRIERELQEQRGETGD